MAEVHVPRTAEIAPAVSTSGVDKDALISRLDALLEQYLNTLDEYEKLMQQLAKQLSSGYFSLTQANFHNRSGVHYGQDSYDERVQATRKITVTEDEDCRLCFSTISSQTPTPKAEKDSPGDENEQSHESEEGFGPDEKPEDQSTEEKSTEKTDATKPKAVDPIRMFGILVPPALRSAQTSFRDAVDGPVVKLAGVTGELRALEREIGRARKAVRKA